MRRWWIAAWVCVASATGCSEQSPLPPLPPLGTSTGPTGGASSPSTSSASSGSSTVLADSSGSKPDGPGVCELRCETRSDCVPAGGDDDDWECDGGFCSDVAFELCDPFTCEIQGNGVCAVVTGLSTCTTPCTAGGSECAQLEGCLGNDDLGNPICTPLPCGGVAEGEPCVTSTGEDRGTCIGGECICMVDEECTADGHACNRG